MNIRPALTVLLLMVSSATLAQDATLIIKADATCDLTVNEEHQGQLTKDVAKAVKTSGGVQLIECKAPNGASVRYLDSVTAGNHTELQIELAALVRAKDENITERFEALGYGMVRDSKTGLVWSQSDNGQGIS